MAFINWLKMLDAFKVDATFMIPRPNKTKTGKHEYLKQYGSIPGFFFTVVATLAALGYFVPTI